MNQQVCSSKGPLALGIAAIAFPAIASAQHGLEEVVVTATPRNLSTSEIAQSVTVLRGEELDRSRSTNLGETLEGQLGLSATYFGTGASRPIIRGLGGARVRTMEDGIESMDVSTISADHAVSVDPLVAEQIEIFRGPTTLLYGSGAVGGVINTVTNRIPEGAPEDGLEAALEVRGDTVANERTGAFALDGGGERFAWHVDAARRKTDDYEIPGFAEHEHDEGEEGHEEEDEEEGHEDEVEGVLENSDLELTSYAVGGTWLGDAGFFGLSVSGFDTQYGIPGHEHAHEEDEEPLPGEPEEEHGEEVVRIDLEQTRVDLKGGWTDLSGGIESVNLRLGVNDYEHVELEGDEIGTRFTNDSYEGRLELVHAPLGRWTGEFGLQLGEREFSAIGAEAFVPPVDTTTYGVFLIEQLEADLWSLSLGARYETQEHVPAGAPAVDDSAVSLSAAAVRELGSGLSLALNLASAERLPVAEELYAEGPHLASGAIEVGDPSLGTETSRHIDIGLRRTVGDQTWSVTAFATRYDDFIFLRDTGVVDPAEELPVLAFTQQDAEFSGLEAEFFTPVASVGQGELDLRIFADYVRAELDDGDNVPRIPPLRYGARLAFHTDRIVIGLEATKYDEQDDVAPFEEPTEGYTLLSADFDWALAMNGGTDLSFFVRGSNLLDEDARRHTSLVKEIAPLPGRNFSMGVRATF